MDSQDNDPKSESPGGISITPAQNPEPPTPAAPAQTTEAAAPVTIQCPSCAAKLQKVTVTPGVKVNCLHCGARFFPANAATQEQTPGGAVGPDAAQPKVREPQSPGYWLLRVPAVVALTAGVFITALVLWEEVRNLPYIGRLEFWLTNSYFPLIALVGVFAFLWSRSLARIDAGMTKQFWNLGLLREPLPPMPGWSLPYIGPFALVGGFFPVFLFGFGDENGGQVPAGAMFGAALFLLGFMAEDVRQFAWRQHIAAEKIAPPGWRDMHRPYPWTAIACAAGFAALAGLEFYIASDYWNRSYSSYYYSYMRTNLIMYICIGLASVAAAITGFMLSLDIERAANSWLRVARMHQQQEAQTVVLTLHPQVSRLTQFACWLPVLWAGYGVVWLLLSALTNNSNIRDSGAWLLLAIASLGLALWLARLMQHIAVWRWAKQTVYATLTKNTAATSTSIVSGWPGLVVRLTVVLTLIEAALLAITLFIEVTRSSVEWRFLFAIPLILGIVQYPTLFVAAATREFLGLEQYFAITKDADEN